MDHNEAVRQNATERYLLDELDPDLRDQFEEHMFDCQECAVDLRAGAMFVEQSKAVLAEAQTPVPVLVPAKQPAKSSWFGWLSPALAVPVMTVLLAVIGYQRFIEVPQLMQAANQPDVLPVASINVSTRGAEKKEVTTKPGQGFLLNLSIPPDASYSAYSLELHNAAGTLQYLLKIAASSPDETRPVHFPGAGLEQGTYTLVVNGITADGHSSTVGNYPIELKFQ
ncbi:MAG TPA: zf-HC2 domain-containing protein [Candidatus Solibacter sp.]|nr:zf-HC2 domain-containing protein [Candidatus Solibacter sp.]